MLRSQKARRGSATALATLLLAVFLGPCSASPAVQRRLIVKMRGEEAMALSAAEAAALAAAPAPAAAGSGSGGAWARVAARSLPAPCPPSPLSDLIAALSSRQEVVYAQEDLLVLPQKVPNDALFGKQWGLLAVGAEAAWDLSVGNRTDPAPPPAPMRAPPPPPASMKGAGAVPGAGASSSGGFVTVCVVDSGVDYSHPQLAASLHPLLGINVVNSSDTVMDALGHGTHISGIIAAAGNDQQQVAGVTWGAAAGSAVRLLSCKFISNLGYGYTSGAVSCFKYCLDSGAAVISASWSAGTQPNPALEEAVAEAQAAGVLVVAAAGNHGLDLSEDPTFPAAYGSTYDNVLTVGSSDVTGDWVNSSSYDVQAVHLSAPGATILSTWPGGFTEYSSGTSMATPFVSGAAALLLAATGRRLSPPGVRRLLLDTVDRLDSHAGKCSSGGRLRMDRALQRALWIAAWQGDAAMNGAVPVPPAARPPGALPIPPPAAEKRRPPPPPPPRAPKRRPPPPPQAPKRRPPPPPPRKKKRRPPPPAHHKKHG
ncbi:hypothetical protein ABPG75_003880 [Micractinium tetrahymenae]